jgi:hypothetical protein
MPFDGATVAPLEEDVVGIAAIVREALRIGRTHKSLWLFGFFVGLGVGGGGGSDGGQPPAPAEAAARGPEILVVLVAVGLAIAAAYVVLKLVSTGALIEGVRRARRSASLTVREGFREGWSHAGVLFKLAALFFLANVASIALLVVPVALVVRLAAGGPEAVVVGVLAGLVGVPWLATLYVWQAFAERIAVLENRHALDAIRKARLFLHGRLRLGLKLLVATFLGAVLVGLAGLAVGAPVVALLVASAEALGVSGAVALGVLLLPPVFFVAIAMIGIVTSSVWTIGYLTEVEA